MLKLSDSSSDDDTDNISVETMASKIRSFIRMKEADSHRNKILDLNGLNNMMKKTRNCRVSDQEEDSVTIMDYDSNSSLDSENEKNLLKCKMVRANSWKRVWQTISESLKTLKQNEQNHKCLEISTSILKLHIDHRLLIDIKCYSLLLHCIRPEIIVQIFEMDLIDKEDMYHIGCLFECEDLFTAINEYADDIAITNKYAVNILKSTSVLLYKYKSLPHARNILKSLKGVLAIFINREENDKKRTPKLKQEINKAIKMFLNASVLNGILNKSDLYDFLMIKNYESISLENSSIDNDTSSNEDEDELVPLYLRNQRNREQKSIGERIKIKPIELCKSVFPLSLQNLTRIEIKNEIKDYSIQGVNKLYTLPNMIKKYVLFEDEINFILKN